MGDFAWSRRVLLHNICWSLAGVVALMPDAGGAQAKLALLREDEPRAKAVAYQAVARKVDRSRYPTYRPGQSCTTCKLLELGSAPQRVCSLFPDRLVYSAGWCNVWVRRGT